MKNKLFNKNLILILIGQMISIFGNSVLRFALPLYILDVTGSTRIFGVVMASSSIPVILFSPVGGLLADRVNKRNMMVILDAITAGIITLFSFIIGSFEVISLITGMMVLLSMIQSLYQPVVRASLPMTVDERNLEKANGTISLVNALSNLAAPFAAGIVYGTLGITVIMILGSICFGLASLMEIFIKIEATVQKEYQDIGKMIKADFKESISYILNENPRLFKVMLIIAGINLSLTSLAVVGLPAMIKIKLGLNSLFYGMTQGIIGAGMIVGGVTASTFGNNLKINNVYILLISASATLLPVGLAFKLNLSIYQSYWIISISYFAMMIIITMFNITMMSYVQRVTPNHLIGKVISYALVMSQCTLPLGNAIYGLVMEKGMDHIDLIVFATAFISISIATYSKMVFRKLTGGKINHTKLEYS